MPSWSEGSHVSQETIRLQHRGTLMPKCTYMHMHVHMSHAHVSRRWMMIEREVSIVGGTATGGPGGTYGGGRSSVLSERAAQPG